MFSKLNLVQNFIPDNQQSILRYGNLLKTKISERIGADKINSFQARPIFTKLSDTKYFFKSFFSYKNASYLDRLFLFNLELLFTSPGLYHIVCQPEYVTSLKLLGKTTIITCHDLIPLLQEEEDLAGGLSPRSKASLLLKWWKLAYRTADHVVCISETTRQDLLRLIDINSSKTSVIYNGLNESFCAIPYEVAQQKILDYYKPVYQVPFILNVGSSYVHKNRPGVIEVFNRLACEFPNLQMVFVGKKFSEIEIEKFNQSPFKSRIHLLTNISDEFLNVLYSLASLLLCPSFYEGFGWPIIEAMACGCPAIGSNQGSQKEIVLEPTFAPNPTDYNQIADICARLLSNESYRQDISVKGLKHIEKFTMSKMIDGYISVYEKLGLIL